MKSFSKSNSFAVFTTFGVLAIVLGVFGVAAVADASGEEYQAIAAWSFDVMPAGDVIGQAKISDAGPIAPRYPDFGDANQALILPSSAYVRIPDSQKNDNFDFDNGDIITVEAWVSLNTLNENAYIIGKGRTEPSGLKSTNQNWAFRLRKHNDQACVNFLFRSRDDDAQPGDWHRWTSRSGFAPGSDWHHVAIVYRFGDPESIRGYVDGAAVDGDWDMGGPTKKPPVVDEDDVWIGSAMGGAVSNSFDGAIDELAVYRTELPAEVLASRFRYVPREIVRPQVPSGRVVMEMFGPHGAFNKFPLETDPPRISWHQDAVGIVRLPNHYDSWGVRDDWTKPGRGTMLVRVWTELDLEAGDYRFLVRSRGLSRLLIDGEEIAFTPAQRNRGGAHHVVDPLPEVPVPGMRPHYMNDHERIVEFRSNGGTHLLRFDVNVGSTNYCLRVGETCVAIAAAGQMFQLVSPASIYPLTDAGWQSFVRDETERLDSLDTHNRRAGAAQQAAYWQRRHEYARQTLITAEDRGTIDQLIEARIAVHNRAVDDAREVTTNGTFYLERVLPILESNCLRCHGAKREGDLALLDRESLLRGGESGEPALLPGKPDESQLLQLVSAPEGDYRMPPEGPGLTAAEIDALRTWIAGGGEVAYRQEPRIEFANDIDDHTFLRRVFLDTVGVVPSLAEIEQFFRDEPSQRHRLAIDRLLRDPRWADNWVGYWQDALAENPNLLKPTLNNTGPFRYWIHDALADNKPLDQFATELITMRGSEWYGGAAGFGIASQNDAPMAAKSHVIGNAFLGVELKCARCHDAPYHDWTQSNLFELAAMLKQQPLALPESSTVPAAFFHKQGRKSLISASLRPGTQIQPVWPLRDISSQIEEDLLQSPDDSRERFALHVTTSRRFAEVMANRIWKRLMGSGIVEPVQDWEGAAPSDPALLSCLADELIEVGFDQKEFVRAILQSEAYQRAGVQLTKERFFRGPARRRMTAEQIVDSSLLAAGRQMRTEMLTLDLEGTFKPDWFFNFGYPKRAWEFTTLANERDRPSLALPRAQAITDVLQAFGWRNSRPEPISVREESPNLIQPGALANGTFGGWLTRLSDESGLTQMMLEEQPVVELVENLFLRFLTRSPTIEELTEFVALLEPGYETRRVPSDEIRPLPARRRYRYVSWSNHLNSEANKIKTEMELEVRKGDPPTPYLSDDWRVRAEDAVWALVNSPEMILIP